MSVVINIENQQVVLKLSVEDSSAAKAISAANRAEQSASEAFGYRGQTEQFKNETLGAKDVAVSAASVATAQAGIATEKAEEIDGKLEGYPDYNQNSNPTINGIPVTFASANMDGRVFLYITEAGLTVIPRFSLDGLNLFIALEPSKKPFTAVGDSMTEGVGSTGGNDYATLLSEELWRSINKQAIGGQNAFQIATRVGAYPVLVEVSSDQILSTGSTLISSVNIDFLKSSSDRIIEGYLNNIKGMLSRKGDSSPSPGTYTFIAEDIESNIDFTNPVLFRVDNYEARKNTYLIWIGRNDVYNFSTGILLGEEVERRVLDIIDTMVASQKNYIVQAICNRTDEGVGLANEAGYNRIIEANAYLKKKFGRRFFDGQALMPKEPGGTGTIQNNLFFDATHFNDAGYAIYAELLAQFITNNEF